MYLKIFYHTIETKVQIFKYQLLTSGINTWVLPHCPELQIEKKNVWLKILKKIHTHCVVIGLFFGLKAFGGRFEGGTALTHY